MSSSGDMFTSTGSRRSLRRSQSGLVNESGSEDDTVLDESSRTLVFAAETMVPSDSSDVDEDLTISSAVSSHSATSRNSEDRVSRQVEPEIEHQLSTASRLRQTGTRRLKNLIMLKRALGKKGQRAAEKVQNSFVNSKRFRDLVQRAFSNCDLDNSGMIEKGELWAGVLWLYIELNKIPWGGRKTPPNKDRVMKLFTQVDVNGDNALSLEEFHVFAQILCRDVVVNESTKMFLVLFLCPLLSTPIRTFLLAVCSVILPAAATLLNSIPEQMFTSTVTAIVIAIIPLLEKWFEMDSDRWTISLTEPWAHPLQHLPNSINEIFRNFQVSSEEH